MSRTNVWLRHIVKARWLKMMHCYIGLHEDAVRHSRLFMLRLYTEKSLNVLKSLTKIKPTINEKSHLPALAVVSLCPWFARPTDADWCRISASPFGAGCVVCSAPKQLRSCERVCGAVLLYSSDMYPQYEPASCAVCITLGADTNGAIVTNYGVGLKLALLMKLGYRRVITPRSDHVQRSLRELESPAVGDSVVSWKCLASCHAGVTAEWRLALSVSGFHSSLFDALYQS